MYKKIKIVKLDSEYCDYLRKYDYKVSYNAGVKELRPYVGVLFFIGDIEYYAPLSSPKEKHKRLKDTIDLIKIENGDFGVINLNNMIPVMKNNYMEFNLDVSKNHNISRQRILLMKKQARWITKNRDIIFLKAELLYKLYNQNRLPKNVMGRCCNYKYLESKCNAYNRITV